MRNVNKIFWLTALSLAFVACQNEDIVNEQIQQGADVYTLQGIVDGSNAQSRAQVQLNSQEPDKEFFIWNSEDQFTVYDIDAETLAGNTFTISESYQNYQNDNPTGEALFDTETPMKTGHQIVAVYPAQTTNAESIDLSITEMTLDQNKDWKLETEWRNYMRQNMFMYAPTTTVSSNTALSFKHLCAMVRITYTNGTLQDQNLTRCELAGSGAFFASAATLDVKTGELSKATTTSEMGISFENLNVQIGLSQDIYLLFFPGEDFTENGKLTFKIYTAENETPLTVEMEASQILGNNSGSTGFEAGKRYWFQVMQTAQGLIWKSNVEEGVISNTALIKSIGNIEGLVKDENGYIKIEESKNALAKVTEIWGNFDTLEGIEYLPNLEKLNCWSGNNLSKMDISKNTKLKELRCSNNLLTSLDVSNNLDLTYIDCGYNRLTSLDVSNNLDLTYIDCGYNRLTSLDVSKLSKLETLVCYVNSLSSLVGLDSNIGLKELDFGYNQLTSLDVSKLSKLETLVCHSNSLSSLVGLDSNIGLKGLYCGDNRLTSLDISKLSNLEILSCHNNSLPSLDISSNLELTILYCTNCQLTALDVSRHTKLTELTCDANQLSTLDVSQNPQLTDLSCQWCALTSLDVSKLTNLRNLICDGNQNLTSLDLSKNTALERLLCYGSPLTSLDLSHNTALTYLDCMECRLTELDITKNTSLIELLCGNQQDENYNTIPLTLTMTSSQKTIWDETWCKNWGGHDTVTPVVSE